jgi:hypothetical protein
MSISVLLFVLDWRRSTQMCGCTIFNLWIFAVAIHRRTDHFLSNYVSPAMFCNSCVGISGMKKFGYQDLGERGAFGKLVCASKRIHFLISTREKGAGRQRRRRRSNSLVVLKITLKEAKHRKKINTLKRNKKEQLL